MDTRADEITKWIAHLACSIERETGTLAEILVGDRQQLEELRSAAAGLRLQAEALQGKLLLRPELESRVYEPDEEPTAETHMANGAMQEYTDRHVPVTITEQGLVADLGSVEESRGQVTPSTVSHASKIKPRKVRISKGGKRESTADTSR